MALHHADEVLDNLTVDCQLRLKTKARYYTHTLPSWRRIAGRKRSWSPLMPATETAIDGGIAPEKRGPEWLTSAPTIKVVLSS